MDIVVDIDINYHYYIYIYSTCMYLCMHIYIYIYLFIYLNLFYLLFDLFVYLSIYLFLSVYIWYRHRLFACVCVCVCLDWDVGYVTCVSEAWHGHASTKRLKSWTAPAEEKKSVTLKENAHFKTSVKDTLKHGGALMSLLSSAPVIVDSRFSDMKPATIHGSTEKSLGRLHYRQPISRQNTWSIFNVGPPGYKLVYNPI